MTSILIVGATSAIARALAAEFAARGHALLLAGRDVGELKMLAADLHLRHNVRTGTYPLDVLAFDTHHEVLQSVFLQEGEELEGVIVCAGYLGDQAEAQERPDEAKRIIDTNFTGCVSVLNLAANHFEKKGRGFICALSSVAGDRGRQSNYLYGSAKAGLSAYLQGLRNRLFHHGVDVVTVKLGFVDTRMTFGRSSLFLVASPEAIGARIHAAIRKGKSVVYLPWFWRYIMLAVRCLPEVIFKRLRL